MPFRLTKPAREKLFTDIPPSRTVKPSDREAETRFHTSKCSDAVGRRYWRHTHDPAVVVLCHRHRSYSARAPTSAPHGQASCPPPDLRGLDFFVIFYLKPTPRCLIQPPILPDTARNDFPNRHEDDHYKSFNSIGRHKHPNNCIL